jgi:hypothetical protein
MDGISSAGVGLGASSFLGKCSTTGVTLPALFALGIFEIQSHVMPRPARLPKYLGWEACHAQILLVEMGFCKLLAQAGNLPISK